MEQHLIRVVDSGLPHRFTRYNFSKPILQKIDICKDEFLIWKEKTIRRMLPVKYVFIIPKFNAAIHDILFGWLKPYIGIDFTLDTPPWYFEADSGTINSSCCLNNTDKIKLKITLSGFEVDLFDKTCTLLGRAVTAESSNNGNWGLCDISFIIPTNMCYSCAFYYYCVACNYWSF